MAFRSTHECRSPLSRSEPFFEDEEAEQNFVVVAVPRLVRFEHLSRGGGLEIPENLTGSGPQGAKRWKKSCWTENRKFSGTSTTLMANPRFFRLKILEGRKDWQT
jgi:hypothetical protein